MRKLYLMNFYTISLHYLQLFYMCAIYTQITIRDVEAGEQITVDYGPAYWQKHGEHVATVE